MRKSFPGNNFSLDGLRNAAEIIFRLHYKIRPLLANILHGEFLTTIFPRKNVWEVLKKAWFVIVPMQVNLKEPRCFRRCCLWLHHHRSISSGKTNLTKQDTLSLAGTYRYGTLYSSSYLGMVLRYLDYADVNVNFIVFLDLHLYIYKRMIKFTTWY